MSIVEVINFHKNLLIAKIIPIKFPGFIANIFLRKTCSSAAAPDSAAPDSAAPDSAGPDLAVRILWGLREPSES